MDSALKDAIENSSLLTDEQKKRFLEKSEDLSPEQVEKAIGALKDSNEKHAALLEESAKEEEEINQKFLAELKQLAPKVMKEMEAQEHAAEETELKDTLSELDNA
jgi:ribosomal protein S20